MKCLWFANGYTKLKMLRAASSLCGVALVCGIPTISGCLLEHSSDRESVVGMVHEYSRLLELAEKEGTSNLPPEEVWFHPNVHPVSKWDDGRRLGRAGVRVSLWSNRTVLCVKSVTLTECYSRGGGKQFKSFGLSSP